MLNCFMTEFQAECFVQGNGFGIYFQANQEVLNQNGESLFYIPWYSYLTNTTGCGFPQTF